MEHLALTISALTIALLPIYTLGLYGAVRYFVKRQSKGEEVNWTPLEAVSIAIAIYFISQLLGGLLVSLVIATQNHSVDEINKMLQTSVSVQFIFILIVESFSAAMVWWFLKRRETALSKIGVVRLKVFRDVGYALTGFVVYFVAYLLLLEAAHVLFPSLNVNQKQDLGFSTHTTGLSLGLVFLSLVILPPLVEELLARGFMYSGLRTKLPVIPAMLITSILFAVAHLQIGSGNALLWVAALDTFTLSLVLVYLREKTGSLWPSIFVHMLKNSIAFIALFVLHSA